MVFRGYQAAGGGGIRLYGGRTRPLPLVQISTLNANMTHFGSNKGGFMGETDKINLKLDKLTANFEELCKTGRFLNDKYDELLSLSAVNKREVKPAGKKY